MMSNLRPCWDTRKIRKDNKILIENLKEENEWGAKKWRNFLRNSDVGGDLNHS